MNSPLIIFQFYAQSLVPLHQLPKKDSRTCLYWKLFADNIINKIHYYPPLEIPSTNDLIDTQIDLFNDLFSTAITKASYQAPVRPAYHIPLSSFLTSLITSRNRLRRKMIYFKNPTDKTAYKNLDKYIDSQIRLACNEHWSKFVNTLSFEDNSLWRITRNLSNPMTFNQPLLINNELQFDEAIKAEFAVQQLSSSMQNHANNPSTDPIADATSLMLSPFTPIDNFIQTSILKIIQTFLKDRKIQVRMQNYISSTHLISAGVPQGSTLSPTLFNFPKLIHRSRAVYVEPNAPTLQLLLGEFGDPTSSCWQVFHDGKNLNERIGRVLCLLSPRSAGAFNYW
ncbi:hypothetical protein J437_LFUL018703 [Ladona fulva]|uniref:Reverse transcriptase domain-containing protein n=1 Tax=Ladona fulva TaxID=123851 RepID=A0A8K0PCI9_LADFU|nr:hypothetical protein J437_LFUL018703 [Ladona fulva]